MPVDKVDRVREPGINIKVLICEKYFNNWNYSNEKLNKIAWIYTHFITTSFSWLNLFSENITIDLWISGRFVFFTLIKIAVKFIKYFFTVLVAKKDLHFWHNIKS